MTFQRAYGLMAVSTPRLRAKTGYAPGVVSASRMRIQIGPWKPCRPWSTDGRVARDEHLKNRTKAFASQYPYGSIQGAYARISPGSSWRGSPTRNDYIIHVIRKGLAAPATS